MHFFCYGTLMFPPIWQGLVKHEYQSEAATLSGFVRKSVINETYPVIYPHAGSKVQGIVYFNLKEPDIGILDRFEGEYYARREISVTLASSETVQAVAYILRDQFRYIADDKEWHPEAFLDAEMPAFMHRYKDFFSD